MEQEFYIKNPKGRTVAVSRKMYNDYIDQDGFSASNRAEYEKMRTTFFETGEKPSGKLLNGNTEAQVAELQAENQELKSRLDRLESFLTEKTKVEPEVPKSKPADGEDLNDMKAQVENFTKPELEELYQEMGWTLPEGTGKTGPLIDELRADALEKLGV